MAFARDGARIVSGLTDWSIHVWDASTGEHLRRLEGHRQWVRAVTFCSNGRDIVSGSDDGTIRVWNLSSEQYARQKDNEGRWTGWLVSPSDHSKHLMFLPQTTLLPDAPNTLTLPRTDIPCFNIGEAKMGVGWAECYTPNVDS